MMLFDVSVVFNLVRWLRSMHYKRSESGQVLVRSQLSLG
jgi:hypothetical protein